MGFCFGGSGGSGGVMGWGAWGAWRYLGMGEEVLRYRYLRYSVWESLGAEVLVMVRALVVVSCLVGSDAIAFCWRDEGLCG